MPAPYLLACLDIADGRLMTPCEIAGLVDAAPEVLARHHADAGATMIYLDIDDGWATEASFLPLVERIAATLDVPLAVMVRSGSLASVAGVQRLLAAGASCYAINTGALERPAVVDEIVATCGPASVLGVVSAARRGPGRWEATSHGGTRRTGRDAVAWAQELAARGAFALVVNARDREGTREGYDLELVRAMADATTAPIIASGGAGTAAHVAAALQHGAHGALGNTMFHRGRCRVRDARLALDEHALPRA